MKRLFLALSAIALAVTFNACEGQDSKNLPEHYQHKVDGHEAAHKADAQHPADAKADPHAKTDSKAADPHAKPSPNATGETKPH